MGERRKRGEEKRTAARYGGTKGYRGYLVYWLTVPLGRGDGARTDTGARTLGAGPRRDREGHVAVPYPYRPLHPTPSPAHSNQSI